MNYNYEDYNNKNKEKKKISWIIIAAIAVSLIANVIMYVVISNNMENNFQAEMDKLDDKIDQALADRLTTEISDMIADNITDEVTQSATVILNEHLTDEVIDNIKREYNLPENYFGIGVKAAENVNSVLEVQSSAELNNQRGTTSSQATAFIINEQGYALTNAHVVTFEDNVYQNYGGISFIVGQETREYTTISCNYRNSSQQYEMEIISYDIEKDLAIIKFINPPENLKSITFGDADLINLGEEVATIGNAQGLGISLTTGVISNTPKNYKSVRVAQTNTTINPGNSGGPLFNIYGEVIGVVSFKIIETMVNEGLGFAICSNSVIEFIEDVIEQKGININYDMN